MSNNSGHQRCALYSTADCFEESILGPLLNQHSAGPQGWFEYALNSAADAGLNFPAPQEPDSKTATVNGLSLRYLDWGNLGSPDLLFIHGFAQQAHSWDFAALEFQKHFHVLSVDLRGHGESEWSPDGSYSFRDFESDIAEFIMATGLVRPALCGLSLGGALAEACAARNDIELSALVVAESTPDGENGGRESIRRFTDASSKPASMESLVARTKEYTPWRSDSQIRGSLTHSLRESGDGRWSWKYDPAIGQILNMRRDESKRWEALTMINMPTLFVRGANSDMTTSDIFKKVVATVPDSQGVTIPDAGHRVAGDNPAAFNHAVRKFLFRVMNLEPTTDGEESENGG